MARNYISRYIKAKDFVNYCKKLNINTDLAEFEHYEKSEILLPQARIIYPDEFVI
jgi:hypothetical protein